MPTPTWRASRALARLSTPVPRHTRDVTATTRVLLISEYGAESPLWWADYNDVVRGRGVTSLLTRCRATNTCPKIFETYGGPEYWYGRGTVGIAGTTGVDDIPLPANVRRYYQVGTTHGGGAGGFSIRLW